MSDVEDRLREIRERLEAATPGLWEALYDTADCQGPADIRSNDDGQIVAGYCDAIHQPEDAEFIANAPTDIAYLLAEIDRLRSLPTWEQAREQAAALAEAKWRPDPTRPEEYEHACAYAGWDCNSPAQVAYAIRTMTPGDGGEE